MRIILWRVILSAAKDLCGARVINWLLQILRCAQDDIRKGIFVLPMFALHVAAAPDFSDTPCLPVSPPFRGLPASVAGQRRCQGSGPASGRGGLPARLAESPVPPALA